MFQVHVMYPNEPGVQFDHDYYRTKHMPLVEKHLKAHGLLDWHVLKGVGGGGDTPAPYVCVGVLVFEQVDGYDKGVQAIGTVLRDDIANFTNVKPTRLVSEVVA